MAKKSRRARRASQIASRALPRMSQQAAQSEVDFSEEYAYVVADLQRIGIIALAMLVILIGLAFIVS
jgi:hypothetical protein